MLRRCLVLRTDEKGDQTGLREDLAQQFKPLRIYFGPEAVPSGRVAARPAKAGDEAHLHRVEAGAEHDRDGIGRLLRRPCLGYSRRDQHRRGKRDQLGRERRQTIEPPLGVSVLDRNILADNEARFFQPLQERGPVRCLGLRGAAAEIANNRQTRLRHRPKWRKRGGTADQREELAAVHYSMTSSARARIEGGTFKPSASAVLRLTTSSNLVGC